MKILFCLNYYTVPGQSLWLKYSIVLSDGAVRYDQEVPMSWLNEQQWKASLELKGSGKFSLEYTYQLRQENGVALDEWHGPRVVAVDLGACDSMFLADSWCSAGSVDYAYETDAFSVVQSARRPFHDLSVVAQANHRFQLRMALVPTGLVPCLIGSVKALGNWGWHSALPLEEVAANVWQKNLVLAVDDEIEYKYGLFDLKLQCVVSMERGENRRLAVRRLLGRQWTLVADEGYRRDSKTLFRGAGVAIPVFSLRSESSFGVGEFADLKGFGDWAKSAGLKLIQILPINDTSSSHDWKDSYPYSAISVFALHPLYLRLDDLDYAMPPAFKKELNKLRESLNGLAQVDYEAVMKEKWRLTRQIFIKNRLAILESPEYKAFFEGNRDWVVAYAGFCVKRDHFGTADFRLWHEWATYDREKIEALAVGGSSDASELHYYIWLQMELDRQLADAVKHLHQQGLILKGDLPIGIDRQSVEAWSAPHLFKLESQAGAPPDAFAVKGQNWGFPTYDWEVMKNEDYAWWRSRFEKLSRYFDVYRIDHILGFFRIWQIPVDQVEGIMGYFDPALPILREEFDARGIGFDYQRFCRPYLSMRFLENRFGNALEAVKAEFLDDIGGGCFQLKKPFSTQRMIVDHFAKQGSDSQILEGLLDCVSEVLFFEERHSQGERFHPRYSLQTTFSYQDLSAVQRERIDALYHDYFYQRQEAFWQACGYEKLPAMRQASTMLLCGEDLGMVPACVSGVMAELGMLSLEIQRMPKTSAVEFFNPANAPYMSVVSPSTHDMSTLRAWWKEDPSLTSRFAYDMLGEAFPSIELSARGATQILRQHLHSPAMWAIFPLQDLLAIDEKLRNPEPEAERINVPAIMPYYWRYRMHRSVEDLRAAGAFNAGLAEWIRIANR